MGKAFDTFAPLGPAIVTLDPELRAAVDRLDLRCSLNGKVLQNSNTRHMVFSPSKIVSCAPPPPCAALPRRPLTGAFPQTSPGL